MSIRNLTLEEIESVNGGTSRLPSGSYPSPDAGAQAAQSSYEEYNAADLNASYGEGNWSYHVTAYDSTNNIYTYSVFHGPGHESDGGEYGGFDTSAQGE